MPYNHGIKIQENPTSIPSPVSTDGFVPVFIGTAPVNEAADISKAVNTPILCNTFAEAQEALGYSDDYANYTLCAAMDAMFKAFGVGPVVFVNVLDPSNANHKTTYTESITLSNKVGVGTSKGVLIDANLVVKNGGSTLDPDTDYTVELNEDGYPVFTVTAAGVTSITVTGDKLAPSGVTAAEVIGSYTTATGKYTGIQCVDEVYTKLNVVPSLIAAPGFSKTASVGLALSEKAYNVSGKFRCECVVDIDATASGAQVYTDVEAKKAAAGFANENMIVCWPMAKYANKIMPYSALYVAMAVYTDVNNENVPNLSPSNKPIKAAAMCDALGNEIYLTDDQANELNAIGVVTAVNHNGFRSWGNNTAAYPGTTDPKDRWIGCRRFFSWWGNRFIITYADKIDDPANYRLIESFVDSENVFANGLVAADKCAGLRMEYRQEDNYIGDVLNGKITFREYLAPYTPAEYVLDILEYDPSMVEEALGGGEA